MFVGGAVVQWLRDGLGLIEQASDVEALAASVPDTGGVYLVPAFTGLGSAALGRRTRAAPSSASRAARPARTSPAPRSRRSPSRARTC